MWTFWKKYFESKKWSNRKIAFVSVLIATSVAFTLIMTLVIPPLIWPSLRIAVGGLPVKITGYIFGPIVGALTGAVSDLLTFAFRPSFFHWGYFLALVIMGIVPGIFGYIMERRWQKNKMDELFLKNKVKINKLNLIITISILLSVILTIFLIVLLAGDQIFNPSAISHSLITNKWVFMAIAISGVASMLIGMFIIIFFVKKETFNKLLPIISFSAVLELAITPLITFGDIQALQTKTGNSFATVMSGHFLFAPIKIWINLVVVFTAYKIIFPLITNKEANGWK